MGSPFLSTTFPVTLNWLDFDLGGGGVFSIISVTCKSAISNWLERLVTASSINILASEENEGVPSAIIAPSGDLVIALYSGPNCLNSI